MENVLKRCSTCILLSCYPTINYNTNGECNFCLNWNNKWKHLDFKKRSKILNNIIDSFRAKTKPYDCVIGLSGGKDSSYVAYLVKKKGLTPLAVTFDNGFLSEFAKSNINSTIKALSLPHILIKPDWPLMLKWYKYFLLTTGEFCSVCNVGIRASLYRVAKSYKIKLLISGTSPRTEAITPSEFFTCSAGYFENVARRYFSKEEIDSFRYFNDKQRIFWHIFKMPYYLQLPNFIPWKEEKILEEIEENLNWQGSLWEQHTDCQMSDVKEYLKLKKFGVTELCSKLSSLILDKQINREKALEVAEDFESKLTEKDEHLRGCIRKVFDVSETQIDEVLKLTHVPFIPKTDSILLKLKNTFYR